MLEVLGHAGGGDHEQRRAADRQGRLEGGQYAMGFAASGRRDQQHGDYSWYTTHMIRHVYAFLLGAALVPAAEVKTIAGNGKAGYAGDQLANPYGLVTGPDGGLYICEVDNHVIRKLDLKTGKLATVAGTDRKSVV